MFEVFSSLYAVFGIFGVFKLGFFRMDIYILEVREKVLIRGNN